jgi:hypothetical protein
MIKRTDDFSAFSDSEFNKLAEVVKKAENKKTFDTYDNENAAEIAAAELRVKGFNSKIERVAGKFKVSTIQEEVVSLQEAEKSGQFQKVAFGRYCFQRAAEIGQLFSYNFNDGSVWKLATDESGNQVLIKEVDDEDEDAPVRQNSNVRVAAKKKKEVRYTSDLSFKSIASILYDASFGDTFLHDATPEVKTALYNMFNAKLDSIISTKLAELNIDDENIVDDIKKLTATALTMDVNSKYTLSKFINSAVKDHLDKVGKQQKHFKK